MATNRTSPTQRTLRYLRQRGGICDIVERFNQYAGPFGARHDLFNFIDLIMLDPERGIIGIQCCGQTGFAEHKRKILDNEIAPEWVRSSGKIELWAWRKLKLNRGGKAMRWTPKVEEITFGKI